MSGKTGEIIWQLGGKNSSFKMPENGEFHFQHDARFPEDNDKTLTVYNNGASNFAKPQNVSAGLWFDLDTDTMTASLRQRYQVWNNALTQAGGNVQPLDNDDGSVFIGQGAINGTSHRLCKLEWLSDSHRPGQRSANTRVTELPYMVSPTALPKAAPCVSRGLTLRREIVRQIDRHPP